MNPQDVLLRITRGIPRKGLDEELQVGGDESSLPELWLPCYNGPGPLLSKLRPHTSLLGTDIEMQILIPEA